MGEGGRKGSGEKDEMKISKCQDTEVEYSESTCKCQYTRVRTTR